MAEETEMVVPEESQEPLAITFKEFLESYPVNSKQLITDCWHKVRQNLIMYFSTPEIFIFCEKCQGKRYFGGKWEGTDQNAFSDFYGYSMLEYKCKNCSSSTKAYALHCSFYRSTHNSGHVMKLGEFPELHLDVSPELRDILGSDFHLFEKGLSCERKGFGIGAAVYYRRVVESQKDQLIDHIIEAALKLNPAPAIQEELQRAREVQSFEQGIKIIKNGIPDSLSVLGHNPLTLLHNILSIGVHEESDEFCLQKAQNIRIVLSDLSENLKRALDDKKELHSAVRDLLNTQTEQARKKQAIPPEDPSQLDS